MRIRAIDWLRGVVMVLMTVDHSGNVFDAAHMHGDTARSWIPGSPLPAGEFLTRWITHLCAPTFVLLAGTSLALSTEKRRGDPHQTRFIATRGLLILALDPLWMSLAFTQYQRLVLQVLYAIGFAMICMAWLRRLPSSLLLALAVVVQCTIELAARWRPEAQPMHAVWCLLVTGGVPFSGRVVCAYPLLPWLSLMMAGWVLGRWFLQPADRSARARSLAIGGGALLALFLVLRGVDGYGNMGLYRDGPGVLQWLHVSKYPPSLTFTCLEVGLALLMLGVLALVDGPGPARAPLGFLGLLGTTAFFYYLLHAHLLRLAAFVLPLDPHSFGLAKTWIAAALVLLFLAWPCARYRRYKQAHPDGWTRYI